MIEKILCIFLGHIRAKEHEKDMFGHEYVYQKEYCRRCDKRLIWGDNMDLFKINNVKTATKLDYNCKTYHSRGKTNDAKMLRRISRRKLKQNISKEVIKWMI